MRRRKRPVYMGKELEALPHGLMTKKREAKLDSFLNWFNGQRVVKRIRKFSFDQHDRAHGLDKDGKPVRAQLLRHLGSLPMIVIPPHLDVKRAVLTVFGGKYGREKAFNIKHTQRSIMKKMNLMLIDHQIEKVKKKKKWKFDYADEQKIKRWKEKEAWRRSKNFWKLEHPAFWIMAASMFIHPGEIAADVALEGVRLGFVGFADEFARATGETILRDVQASAMRGMATELAAKGAEMEVHDAYHGLIGAGLNFAQTHWVEYKLKKLLKR